MWANAYVGVPYADQGRDLAGCDCWGLARLVYGAELQIALPSYVGDYTGSEESAEIASLIGAQTTDDVWTPADPIAPFDLILFRHGRFDSHVGIALGPRAMLHMAGEDQAKVGVLTDARWARRIVGAFRHRDLFGKGAS